MSTHILNNIHIPAWLSRPGKVPFRKPTVGVGVGSQ